MPASRCSVALIAALVAAAEAGPGSGAALRTIAEDSDTALLLGVDVGRIVPLVFVISGLFAALAGVLFALNYRQVHPFMGEALGLKGISAMVVGGMGNIWGAIAGGLIIGLAEVLSIDFFGADFVDIAVYGLLLLILIVRPTGLFGGAQRGSARMSGYARRHPGAARDQRRVSPTAPSCRSPRASSISASPALPRSAATRRPISATRRRSRRCSPSRSAGSRPGLVALVVAVPVLRTRGIYLALATFALGEIVRATILNLEVVGGAAGYPVTAFIRLADRCRLSRSA